MTSTDIKIFELIDLLKSLGIIRFDVEFCEASGLLHQNLIRIKQGKAHFTPEHVKQICKAYNVNANWIFELQENPFNRKVLAKN